MFKINLLFYALFGSFILTNSSVLVARDTGDESNKENKIFLSYDVSDKKKEKTPNKRSRYKYVPNPLDPNQFFVVDLLESKQKINNRKRVKTEDIQIVVVDPWVVDLRLIGNYANQYNFENVYDLQPHHLLENNIKITDFRHDLYKNFHASYVQPEGGKFKFHSPKGIYTKYKDMRSEDELQSGFYEGMNLTQNGFFDKMGINRAELVDLLWKSGRLLLTLKPHLTVNKSNRVLYEKIIAELHEIATSYLSDATNKISFYDFIEQFEQYVSDGNNNISFNEFLYQLEKVDAFLEEMRQVSRLVFQTLVSIETIGLITPEPIANGQQKFVPFPMKTGIR